MNSWMRFAGRFVLPALLLAGAVGAWFVADELGSVTQAPATRAADTTNDLTTPVFSVRRVPDFATGSSQEASIALAVASLPPDPGGL